ncbi:hypothetical protein VOLCADRAFT_103640 [Volvox carteri f. nagariensis]|uniref:Aldehyde dehydrogenase domain-containing protein n=1 Tax=Volvox carteri f. nagariensis TaxID=3068 RepID=D8TNK2_VOLCA|nr:uncharacterized protein VOLCADRAFT_103640 [Volvox carteri f. nagariensis]EFJ50858.1 hypothetical protein VOLCADRAFT_103640 [Volvox carteri f. nagariensis]|eukprot:XP_002947870.1 hypothetical protein VOLCADRAFT_103640 [Volvox carteri f. nagariensis]
MTVDPPALIDDAPAEIDQALTELEAKKKTWANLALSQKIALLDAVRVRLLDKMNELARLGAEVKASTDEHVIMGEMLVAVMAPAVYIHKLLHTLRALAATGKAPKLPVRITQSGQRAVQVFPVSWSDRHNLVYPGVTAELVLRPEVRDVRQAELYDAKGRVKGGREGLCAVLGAGNHVSGVFRVQGFLTLKDVLVCLYERGQVVAVKPHPLWFEWHRVADYVLQPLIRAGFVQSLYLPDVDSTRSLVYSTKLDCVHLTGGIATHDAIVWGSTVEEQQRRRQANDPLLKVPITSELGCVTPFILPGWDYTPAQLRVQAENLVLAVAANCGCNCNSAKVLLMPADWNQGEAFLENVRTVLRGMPMDPPFYPGIQKRHSAAPPSGDGAALNTPRRALRSR